MARTQKISCTESTFTCRDDAGQQHEISMHMDEDGSVKVYVNGLQFPARYSPYMVYGVFSACNTLLDKMSKIEEMQRVIEDEK